MARRNFHMTFTQQRAYTWRWLAAARGIVAAAALVLSTSTLAAADVHSAKRVCEVRLHDGKLDARLQNAPLRQVLLALQRETGVAVHLASDEGEDEVSFDAVGLPIAEAVEAILQGKNFALRYTAAAHGRRLETIWVLPGWRAAQPPAEEHMAAEDLDADLAAPAYLDEPLGLDRDSVDSLVQVARTDADPRARIEALATLAVHAGGDALARAAIAEIAGSENDPDVHAAAIELSSMQ